MEGEARQASFDKLVAEAGEIREEDYEKWRTETGAVMLGVWEEMCRHMTITNMRPAFAAGRSPGVQACVLALEAMTVFCAAKGISVAAIREARS